MEFNDNFGVYVCSHVFIKESPVLVGIRDPEGDWQFFCGDENCAETSKPHFICVGHLTLVDPTINDLTCLNSGYFAQRIHANADWEYGELE